MSIKHPVQKLGAVLEANASLASLADTWRGYDELTLVLPHLVDDGYNQISQISWITSLLNSVKIKLLLLNPLPERFENTSTSLRKAMEVLLPYIKDGALSVSYLSSHLDDADLLCVPIAIANPSDEGGKLWFGENRLSSLNVSSSIGDIFSLSPTKFFTVVDKLRVEFDRNCYGADYFSTRAPVRVYKYNSGASRNLDEVFDYVRGKYIQAMTIRDPYTASSNTVRYLKGLATNIKSFAQDIEKTTVDCRLIEFSDDYREYNRSIKHVLADECGFKNISVNVFPARKKKDFHDRRITFSLIDDDGASETVVYELSGGISNLMNEDYEATITMYKVNEFGKVI